MVSDNGKITQDMVEAARVAADYEEALARGSAARKARELQEALTARLGSGTSSLSLDVENPINDDDEGVWDEVGLLSSQGVAGHPMLRSLAALTNARAISRWLYVENETLLGIQEARIDYVLGEGVTWNVTPLDGFDEDLAEQVEDWLEEWGDAEGLLEREEEIVERRDRDGEVFLRLFRTSPDRRGMPRLRFVEPEHVVASPDGQLAPFGIETDPDDAATAVALYLLTPAMVRAGAAEGQRMPFADVLDGQALVQFLHLRANVTENTPRGWPTVWPCRRSFARGEKLLRNMSMTAGLQAAIAMIREHQVATRAQVESYLDSNRDLLLTDTRSGRDTRYTKIDAGTVIDAPSGVTYKTPIHSINAADHVAILQAERRAQGTRYRLPEYAVSSDASNANFASTQVAESPMVKHYKRLQGHVGRFLRDLRWAAVGHGVFFGALPEEALRGVEIRPTFPSVEVRDMIGQSARLAVEHEAGVVSRKTWRTSVGYDSDQEDRLLEEEAGAGLTSGLSGDVELDGEGEDDLGDLPQAAAGAQDVERTALNGAQVTSLVELAMNVSAGLMPEQAALEIARVAFPAASPESLQRIMSSAAAHTQPAPTAEPVAPSFGGGR